MIRPPPIVYHYTDRRGLIGIVEQKVVWATHVRYLNDASEYTYTAKFARALAPHLATTIPESDVKDAFSRFVDSLAGMEVNTNRFVFSLSADGGDRLSQWRGYGKPADAYSIGFESVFLEQLAAQLGALFEPCVYDRVQQDRLIRALLNDCINMLRTTIAGGGSDDALNSVISLSLGQFDLLAASLKDPAFQEEEEWRLVLPRIVPPVSTVLYRPGRSLVTPYVEVPITLASGKVPIRQVVIGPAPHTPLDAGAVIRMCHQHGVFPTEVPYSIVPFRAW